jgi:hypothetical protein
MSATPGRAGRAGGGTFRAARQPVPRDGLVVLVVAALGAGCGESGADREVADAAAVADASADPDGGSEPDANPASCEPTGGFDLNDVSFLFPLPASPAERGDLLAMADAGGRGELLPASVFAELPAPLHGLRDVSLADLHVVSARVDPCFVSRSDGPCRSQVRLVVQPVRLDNVVTRADDAAVHLFYDLDEAGFADLVAALDELRALAGAATGCRPLGVHPVMQAEGLRGPYALRLRQAILDGAGASNLVRVAVMQLQQPGSVWRFTAFDLAGDELVRLPVPRTGGLDSQAFSLSDTETNAGFLDPSPEGSLVPLLLDPSAIRSASMSTLAAAGAEAFAIENPGRHDTTDTDCVSCHVTRRALANALAVREFEPDDAPAYANPRHDLSLVGNTLSTGSQRAFGYFDSEPSIAPRVIDETAEVADALSAR